MANQPHRGAAIVCRALCAAIAAHAPSPAEAKTTGKHGESPRNMWTDSADSCARVAPYCTLFLVKYDISCGGQFPEFSKARQANGAANSFPDDLGGFCVGLTRLRGERGGIHELGR